MAVSNVILTVKNGAYNLAFLGSVIVDGLPLQQYSLKDFRSRISFVSQVS